jgi:acyl carrier protein
MSKSEIRNFIIENFLFGDGHRLDDSASLLETHLIDSTGILEIVSFLENHFGLSIDDQELRPEHLDSVDNITRFVEKKLGAAVG